MCLRFLALLLSHGSQCGVHQPSLNTGLDAALLPVKIKPLLLDTTQFVDGGAEGFNEPHLEVDHFLVVAEQRYGKGVLVFVEDGVFRLRALSSPFFLDLKSKKTKLLKVDLMLANSFDDAGVFQFATLGHNQTGGPNLLPLDFYQSEYWRRVRFATTFHGCHNGRPLR